MVTLFRLQFAADYRHSRSQELQKRNLF